MGRIVRIHFGHVVTMIVETQLIHVPLDAEAIVAFGAVAFAHFQFLRLGAVPQYVDRVVTPGGALFTVEHRFTVAPIVVEGHRTFGVRITNFLGDCTRYYRFVQGTHHTRTTDFSAFLLVSAVSVTAFALKNKRNC